MREAILMIVLAGLGLTGCGGGSGDRRLVGGGGVGEPVPVVVVVAERRDVAVPLEAIGRVVTVASVSVKPQVTGRLTVVHFEEGQMVAAGDLLISIDPRPFEVALAQAQAELAEAVSGAENARDQARRYTELNRTGGASREQIEQYVTAARQSAAQVESAQAAVREAELELAYCSIRAAIGGRTGRHVVTAGNVVTANQTELVVIHQLAPIDVAIAVPERQLAALQAGMAAGPLRATAVVGGDEPLQAMGEVRFLDNSVRAETGTIELKARFPNEPAVLWPGQFVTVVLDLAMQRDVVVVPAGAPQPGEHGSFVFVVGADGTVEVRPVRVDRTHGEDAVITDGLKGGELVVTDGQSRLTRGIRVSVKESLEAAAAAAIRTRP